MSIPGNINTAPPPSSFDGNEEFYSESRWQKLRRRVFEEPLIPLGCALTCWALFEATRSIRMGDKERTNRMFRRRVYAQGFTLLAMIAGQVYWQTDHGKRKEWDTLQDDKKKATKHELWLKELEARDAEEQELRRYRDEIMKKGRSDLLGTAEKKADEIGKSGGVSSALEACERRRGGVLQAVTAMLEGRR